MEELVIEGLKKMCLDLERMTSIACENTKKLDRIIKVALEIRDDLREIKGRFIGRVAQW